MNWGCGGSEGFVVSIELVTWACCGSDDFLWGRDDFLGL